MKSSLSKSVYIYTIGNIFVKAITFILLPLYSQKIPVNDFGVYGLLLSFYVLASVFFQAGLSPALTKYFLEADNLLNKRRVFSTIFLTVTLISMVLFSFISLFHTQFSIYFLNSENKIFILIAAILLFETIAFYGIHLLRTLEQPKKVITISLASAIINVLLNFYFIYFNNYSYKGIFYSQLGSALTTVVFLFPLFKDYLVFNIDKQLTKKIFYFTFPLLIGAFLTASLDFADRFFLNYYLTKTDVGLYSFSYRIAMIMNVFALSFRVAWMPFSLNNSNTINLNQLYKYTVTCSLIFIFTVVGAKYLFFLNIFNNSYQEGLSILPFVLGAYYFNGVAGFFSTYPYRTGKSFHLLNSDLLGFIIYIILNIVLIPILGINGAAIATFCGYLITALYLMLINRIEIEGNYKKIAALHILVVGLLIITLYFKGLVTDIVIIAIITVIFLKINGIKTLLFKD